MGMFYRHRVGMMAAACAMVGAAVWGYRSLQGAQYVWQPARVSPAPEGAEWIALLDAAHAGGWASDAPGRDLFEIRDGELHIHGRSFWPLRYVTYTGRTFSEFDLYLQYRMTPGANSGLFLNRRGDAPDERGFEIQLLEDAGAPPTTRSSGAVYGFISPMFNTALPAGEWNSLEVRLEGGRLQVRQNSRLVIHAELRTISEPSGRFDAPLSAHLDGGYIALQDHGGEIWVRNLKVRPLERQPVSAADRRAED